MKTSSFPASFTGWKRIPLLLVAVMASVAAGGAMAADIGLVGVLKGQRFVQTSQGMVSLEDRDGASPLRFEVRAAGTYDNALLSGTVGIPDGGVVPLASQPGDAELRSVTMVETPLDLDTARPGGTYQVSLVTQTEGVKNFAVPLVGDVYPKVPFITNYTALQAASADSSLVIQWEPMEGTTNDVILCSVYDDTTGATVHETGLPGSLGSLNGTATEAMIPAGKLQAGHQYHAEVIFVKIIWADTSYTMAFGGYYKLVGFPIQTLAQSGMPLGAQFVKVIPGGSPVDVPRSSAVSFEFSKPMTPLGFAGWSVDGESVDPAEFIYQWTEGNRVLICRPTNPWPAGANVQWVIDLADFKDAAGFSLSGNVTGSFVASSDAVPSGDVQGLYVAKVRGFRQHGNDPVATGLREGSFEVEQAAFNAIRSASLTSVASGHTFPLWREADSPLFEEEAAFASQADLDRFLPNGDFTFQLTKHDGSTQSVTMSLGTADDYPAAPRVTNLAALQSADPKSPVLIQWDPLAGWSNQIAVGSGMIQLEIEDSGGNEVAWIDNEQLSSGTSVQFPVGTFWPGRVYHGSLQFIRIKDLEDGGFLAGAGFTSVTEFTIAMTGEPVMPLLGIGRQGEQMRVTAEVAEPNRGYVLETSSDLSRWLPQCDAYPGQMAFEFLDADAKYFSRRFYRLRDRGPDEWVRPNVAIQGTVWSNASRTSPVAGAVVGTSLDGRTTVTDRLGRFFLETDTPSMGGFANYFINISAGATTRNFGPSSWGDQPREQHFELN